MNIGKRQRVQNLRAIWPKETDFSDWLATEDGLALLAEDIGIEIEEPRRECRPGDFPCDIVGRKVGDENHVVVIENQFGKTNHDHLGKLLTYAAMNSAMTGIWLSETVSDDHRKVIDWLNDNTPTQVSLYLAEIKAYRIGDSPVAPQLDVVCRPNLEAKVQHERTSGLQKENDAWRSAFWNEVLPYIKSQNPPFHVPKPGTGSWVAFSIGPPSFRIALNMLPSQGRISCDFVFDHWWKQSAFDQLQNDKTAIENEIGSALEWYSKENVKLARIRIATDIDPKDLAQREAVRNWMYQKSMAFYRTFQPRVKQLQEPISSGIPEERENVSEELSAL